MMAAEIVEGEEQLANVQELTDRMKISLRTILQEIC